MLWGAGITPSRLAMPVSIMDIAPTILEAVGIEAPQPMAGISLWSALHGRPASTNRLFIAERRGSSPEHKAVIRWPYKLIAEEGMGSPRLYDLAADSGETRPINDAMPELVDVLSEKLARQFEMDSGRAPEEGVELSEEDVEQLRALGYLD
jgi:arylsulfatase A-like enzyme